MKKIKISNKTWYEYTYETATDPKTQKIKGFIEGNNKKIRQKKADKQGVKLILNPIKVKKGEPTEWYGGQ